MLGPGLFELEFESAEEAIEDGEEEKKGQGEDVLRHGCGCPTSEEDSDLGGG